MKANIVDLRYQMKEVLGALDRGERVSIMYHGKLKGIIIPANEKGQKSTVGHPLFGSLKEMKEPVAAYMKRIRKARYHDL